MSGTYNIITNEIVFSSNNVIMIYRIDGNILRADDTIFRYDGFLNGHDGDILCMDHNGDLLATGSTDKTVKLWSGVSLNVFRTTAEQEVSTAVSVEQHTLKYQVFP